VEVAVSVILTVVGLVMLCFGGSWLVNGASVFARRFGISEFVIGLTVVAVGTSIPELAASVAAAISGHGSLILGNIVGSNIANIGMVIGVSAILVPIVIQKSVLKKQLPIMLGVSILLIIISIDGEISPHDGLLLLGGLGVFGVYTFKDVMKQRKENQETVDKDKHHISIKSILLMVIGVGLLFYGATLTVDNAIILAKEFGLSEKIIGLTVIAIGTSLPELVTSIIAIKRKQVGIGIGTIIGSNIYNILMIMGIGAALGGVIITSDVYVDYAIMIIFSISILIALKTGIINRAMGVCLTIGYVAYLVVTFFK